MKIIFQMKTPQRVFISLLSFRCSHSSLCCIKDGKFLYFFAIHLENSIFGQFCRLYYPLKREVSGGEHQNALVVIIFFCQASFLFFWINHPKGVKKIKFFFLLSFLLSLSEGKTFDSNCKGIEKPFLQTNDDKKGCIWTGEKRKDFCDCCGNNKKNVVTTSLLTSLKCTFPKFFLTENCSKIFFLLNSYFWF